MGNMVETLKDNYKDVLPRGALRNVLKSVYYSLKNPSHMHRKDGLLGIDVESKTIWFPKSLKPCILTIPDEIPYYAPEIDYDLSLHDLVVDAGAFPGDYSVYASQKGAENIVALEPDPENRRYLNEVLKINGITNVNVLPYALSDRTENSFIYQSGPGSYLTSKDTGIIVQTTTIDEICREFSHPFIKMDIEGAEIEAMKGAEKLLERDPVFSIACYHERNGQQTRHWLERFFLQKGYATEIINQEHLTLYAYRDSS